MNRPLQDKVALVTGASRGIGAAIARRLAHDGAHVLLHYGSGQAETSELAASIEAAGGTASVLQADLATLDGPTRLAAAASAERIDILVNNAGVAPFANIEDMDEASYDLLSNVNMRSVFLVTQKLLPRIPHGGCIVNVSSVVARAAFSGIPAYAATKGFVNTLTVQLAAALGPRGIRVNAVAPGAIDTRMSSWIHQPGGAEALAQMQALAGIGQPEQIASVVAFLAGPDAAWTTGQIVEASGGTKL